MTHASDPRKFPLWLYDKNQPRYYKILSPNGPVRTATYSEQSWQMNTSDMAYLLYLKEHDHTLVEESPPFADK